ncbi:hypothetical protein BD626DRAFT_262808 [Schizophyllum amplum]|uniref:Uncharacterized protein n=1 Tax=Schizophyllum amplum TaxID=97359 RepID=A0A550CGH8_9AGAR|nr:hypothetical protein BD626DRAFT_262808 [Auriculariopsis ampla]
MDGLHSQLVLMRRRLKRPAAGSTRWLCASGLSMVALVACAGASSATTVIDDAVDIRAGKPLAACKEARMDGRYLLHTSTSTIYATAGGAYDDKQWAYSSSLEYMRAPDLIPLLLITDILTAELHDDRSGPILWIAGIAPCCSPWRRREVTGSISRFGHRSPADREFQSGGPHFWDFSPARVRYSEAISTYMMGVYRVSHFFPGP